MARLTSLILVVACALLGSHFSAWLFANAPSQSLRSQGATRRAVDERDEGLVLIKPEESGKVVKRDKFNNPPRIAESSDGFAGESVRSYDSKHHVKQSEATKEEQLCTKGRARIATVLIPLVRILKDLLPGSSLSQRSSGRPYLFQVMKTNDWDQPEIQLSTGASNQAGAQ
ncbi:unnamed protein product [Durusdinium trenchii]|uniref:Uncharacterized protein n=1 Tax=Durusdinium trenchii TaxID=1381693 RepID=A0ABP0PHB7_9DINO